MLSSEPSHPQPSEPGGVVESIAEAQAAPSTRTELAEVLDVAFLLGRLMAESGAAAFRVRHSMTRVASTLGVRDLDIVVTADAIIATLLIGDQFRTRVQRIPHLGVDMNRVSRLEVLSREFPQRQGTLFRESLDWLGQRLDELSTQSRPYPIGLTGPLLGGSCAAFCGAMDGTPQQMAATFLGTYLGHLLRLRHIKKRRPVAAMVVSCAFLSAMISWSMALALGEAAHLFSWSCSETATAPGKAVVSSVLYLIPGVPLVNSLIDFLHADYTAGLGRGAFAALILVAIAAGVLGFLSLTGHQLV